MQQRGIGGAQRGADRRVCLVSRGADRVEAVALGPQVPGRQIEVAAAGLGVEEGEDLLAGQPAAQRCDRRAQVTHGTQETPVKLFFSRGLRHGIPQL